jgi:Cu-Zn family superoxide dismutase
MARQMVLNGLFALTLAIVFSGGISEAKGPVRASAEIQGCTDPNIIGTAQLKEEKTDEGVKEVRVMMMVKGLTPGKHAVHIHEAASCGFKVNVPCGLAEGHFDPGPNSNSSPDGNHPFHSGDLINIEANRRGNAHLNTTTTRVTLSSGPLSIFEADGSASSAFIIHVNPDTYCPDGAVGGCAGGGRAACGVIELED